ncbi:MAG: rhodanese-like domain-containing protein [Pyrinomonadaceae bacterium]
MRFNLMIIVALLFGFGVLTACQDTARPVKVEQAKAENTAIAPQADEHDHADDAPRITLEEAKKDFDAGNAVFVDTRADGSYKTEHIKGAINVPAEAAEMRYKEIPTGKKIIAYCS